MINMQGTNIGEAIRLMRESKGMTRAELSEAAGVKIGRASCRERV